MEPEEEDALLSSLTLSSDSDDASTNPKAQQSRRAICLGGCGRPSSVCICPFLPSSPIPTSTTVLLLHHPHSLRSAATNTLSTIPPLSLSLLNLHLVSGRRLDRLPPHLHHHRRSCSSVLFLFPSLPSSLALPISDYSHRRRQQSSLLIVLDGTWTQAREMAAASLPFLKEIGAAHVSIGEVDPTKEGVSSVDSKLAVRKEPYKGCTSTMEAVARALRVLEGDEAGAHVEERLLGILKAMVGFQMRNVREVKTRVKMRKRKEIRNLEMQAGNELNE